MTFIVVLRKFRKTPSICRKLTFRRVLFLYSQEKDLIGYYQAGMKIDQLAKFFGKDEDAVREKLTQKGIAI